MQEVSGSTPLFSTTFRTYNAAPEPSGAAFLLSLVAFVVAFAFQNTGSLSKFTRTAIGMVRLFLPSIFESRLATIDSA